MALCTNACTEERAPAMSRSNLTGEVTWSVTFDAEAKAAGASDCSYTRRYIGVEDTSRPWGCPGCDQRFRTEVEIIDGLDTCYRQVSGRPPGTEEWLGLGDGPWWRGRGALMSQQGTASQAGGTVTLVNSVSEVAAAAGGMLSFDIAGELQFTEESGDPLNGFRPPESYACGWNKADPPPYVGDYTLAVGATVPDGAFKDVCDEPLRLHDLAGTYLVISMSAADCPPCQAMAVEEERFIADMAAENIAVSVVTLMAPALTDTLGLTTLAILESWASTFALASPVLADRGWGLSVFQPALGDNTGYPSWAIVDPALTVIGFGTGYDDWSSFAATLRADAAAK